jgi:hypothetical protein
MSIPVQPLIKNSLIEFIKDTLLVLSCSTNIDHRNYNYERRLVKRSRLQNLAKTNSLDESIKIIVSEVINNNILQLTESDIESDYDSDDDDSYQKNYSLFNKFIRYVGLYEILNLHGDDQDKFQERFITIITNNL